MTRDELLRQVLSLASQDRLDELVYDTAQECGLDVLNTLEEPAAQEEHICTAERIAAAVNNEGYAAQIDWLLAQGIAAETIAQALAT